MAQNTADPVLVELADEVATSFADAVMAIERLATEEHDGEMIAMLLLELSAVLLEGARLGALADVLPRERFEPDTGHEPDLDRIRLPMRERLGELDTYGEVFDPYNGDALVVRSALSDDLATIVDELLHGLAHHRAGRPVEALWWWQFSYITSWGPAASAALRAVQSLVAHVRLGSPLEE